MENTVGIDNTKDLLKGMTELVGFLIDRLHDGVGFDDAVAVYSKLFTDEAFKTHMLNAIKALPHVNEELKNLTTDEVTALAFGAAPDIAAILLKLKK